MLKGKGSGLFPAVIVLVLLVVAIFFLIQLAFYIFKLTGQEQATIITVKTAVDYSHTYGHLAGVSSIHGAIFENGMRGGYAPP